MNTKFCTVEEVNANLTTENTYTGNNALIATQIEHATALIRAFTRRAWDRNVYTDYLDTVDIDTAISRGRGAYIMSLREKPVSVEDSVYPKLRYNTAGRWDNSADLDRSLYNVDVRKNQIIMYPGIISSNARSMRVTYTAGYAPDAGDPSIILVPDHIRLACIAQASYGVRRIINNTNGTDRKEGQERLGAYKVGPTGLIGEALALVKSEVRLLVGGNA